MHGYLRNFQNTRALEKFLKSFKNIPSNTYRDLGKFPDTQAFGKFLVMTFLIIAVTPS